MGMKGVQRTLSGPQRKLHMKATRKIPSCTLSRALINDSPIVKKLTIISFSLKGRLLEETKVIIRMRTPEPIAVEREFGLDARAVRAVLSERLGTFLFGLSNVSVHP